MKVKEYDINQLISAEYNPRQLSQRQYQNLRNSIQRFGLVDPILINVNKDRKNIIIGGHQRVNIAKVLEIKKVPCVELDLTLEQERELNIRLNQNTGDWDFDVLADNFDLDELMEFGFEEKDLKLDLFEVEEEGLTDDDDIPEDVESVCKLGDLWKLGNHRLLCDDSTKKENIELLLDGNKADMVFTDPPYGIDVVANSPRLQETKKLGSIGGSVMAKTGKYKPVIGDEDTGIAIKFIQLTNDIDSIIWGGNYFTDVLKPSRGWIVWDKKNGDTTFADAELAYTTLDKSVRIYEYLWSGMRRAGNRKDESKYRLHPTQKPVGLFADVIKDWCKDKINILDGFLGSGSTLIACEKTNRVCYGMELDPHYCDVIINRWEQYTGKKAELINGET